MGSITQLAEKCQKCKKANRCKKKRMEACAYIDDPNIAAVSATPAAAPTATPILRETVHVCIGGIETTVYKDDLEKLLYEHLYRDLGCSFINGA